jgi:hypothetical protein
VDLHTRAPVTALSCVPGNLYIYLSRSLSAWHVSSLILQGRRVIPESSRWPVCDKGARIGIESMTKTACSVMSGDATERITLARKFPPPPSLSAATRRDSIYIFGLSMRSPNHFCRFQLEALFQFSFSSSFLGTLDSFALDQNNNIIPCIDFFNDENNIGKRWEVSLKALCVQNILI